MTLISATGQGASLDGREAAIQATRQALEQLGKKTAAFAIVAASHHYQFSQILSGITPLLGDTPLLGFSTAAELSPQGMTRRSVVVSLFSGDELQASTDWWPGFDKDSQEATQKMAQALHVGEVEGTLLVIAEGLNGDVQELCENLPAGSYQLVGGLAGGDLRRGKTSQMGGKKAGSGGIAAAFLTGEAAIGIGCSHAWQPIGPYFTVTGTLGHHVTTLDNLPAHESYARMLGYAPQDWTTPPLNELARLYPLGLEQEGQSRLLIRSPLRIEVDGSLWMNTGIPTGSVGHLMIGGIESCLDTAAITTRHALGIIGEAKPVLALVLADVSYQMQLEAQPGSDLEAIRAVLGPQVPVIGGYTFGQIRKNYTGVPELANQHITVIVFGEKNP